MIFAAVATLASTVASLPVSALPMPELDHLLRRAAFDSSVQERERFAAMTRGEVTDALLEDSRSPSPPQHPDWARKPWDWRRVQPDTVQDMVGSRKKRPEYRAATRRSVLESVLNTSAPLRDRMWLFWMSYFAIFNADYAPHTVWDLQELYDESLGDYRELLRWFSRSFSAQQTLDLEKNRAGNVNENFARELLELYSLGPGYYTQRDIRETARAFTGWRRSGRTGWFLKWPPWHDYGLKTVLGTTGRLDGNDVLAILYDHPRFAEHLVERLWLEFISPTPDPAALKRIADAFRADYDIRKLLHELLSQPAFWSPQNRQALVKSPVDLVVGALHRRGVRGAHGAAMDAWTAAMGQPLLRPPDVKGWRGHTEWLTVGTLETRLQFSHFLRSGPDSSILATLAGLRSSMMMTLPEEQELPPQEALWQALEATPLPPGDDPDEVFAPQFQLK
jgi:uncharacterized protein (DUF1800 family)